MSAEHGLFTDEGCIERGIYGEPGGRSAEEVGQARIAELRTAGDLDAGDVVQVEELCPDHEEEPRENCQECYAELDWQDRDDDDEED